VHNKFQLLVTVYSTASADDTAAVLLLSSAATAMLAASHGIVHCEVSSSLKLPFRAYDDLVTAILQQRVPWGSSDHSSHHEGQLLYHAVAYYRQELCLPYASAVEPH
jgi:hypothetical protein